MARRAVAVPVPRPEEAAFLRSIVESGGENSLYLILADWLEEKDDPRRGELLRLHRRLLATCCQPEQHPERTQWQARMVTLLSEGVRPSVPTTAVLGMTFAWCPPGDFLMGSPASETTRGIDETQHPVTLTQGFWLGATPVTQDQWQAVMGSNPSRFKGKDRPVEQVSWFDCEDFCVRFRDRTGSELRLPTEREWEYACRAGTTTPFFFGATITPSQAAFDASTPCPGSPRGSRRQRTTSVGRFPANAWGLYDVHGNVWEWCADAYGPYPASPSAESSTVVDNGRRVVRGGAWNRSAGRCRSACRASDAPDHEHENIGCRLVLCPS